MGTTVKLHSAYDYKLAPGAASFRIEKTFKGIGQIRVSAETDDPKQLALYLGMLDAWYENVDYWHWLEALRDKRCSIRELHRMWRDSSRDKRAPVVSVAVGAQAATVVTTTDTLGKYGDVANLTPISDVLVWIRREEAAQGKGALARITAVSYARFLANFLKGHEAKKLAALPMLLAEYKKTQAGNPIQFNHTRAAVLSYFDKVHADLNRAAVETLVKDVRMVDRFGKKEMRIARETKRQTANAKREKAGKALIPSVKPGITIPILKQMLSKATPKDRDIMLSLYVSGLGPTEYDGSEGTRIVIHKDYIELTEHGKNDARIRRVPLFGKFVHHDIDDRYLREMVKKYDDRFSPRDFRLAFIANINSIGDKIPVHRREAASGHNASTMDMHYCRTHIWPYIEQDAKVMRAWFAKAMK